MPQGNDGHDALGYPTRRTIRRQIDAERGMPAGVGWTCARCGAAISMARFIACNDCWALLPAEVQGELFRTFDYRLAHKGLPNPEHEAALARARTIWATDGDR